MTQYMSGDRELLELAAKAASQPGAWIQNEYEGWGFWQHPGGGEWNPLTDDGDALRLGVILKLLIDPYYNGCAAVGSAELACEDFMQPLGDDPFAATRRAIVRAAAEIGRRVDGGAA